jgi:hypothetical protein
MESLSFLYPKFVYHGEYIRQGSFGDLPYLKTLEATAS